MLFRSAIIWLAVSIPVGVLSALRPRSIGDRVTTVLVLIAQSLPVYYFGLLALYFLAYKIPIFPLGGYEPFSLSNPWPWFSHLILPAMVLALQFAALYVRLMRSQMLDVAGEDYIRTARAKGVSERSVLFKHALRNALIPFVTSVGILTGYLLGGAIVVEQVFAIPGLGRLILGAIAERNYPLLQATILVVTCGFVEIGRAHV